MCRSKANHWLNLPLLTAKRDAIFAMYLLAMLATLVAFVFVTVYCITDKYFFPVTRSAILFSLSGNAYKILIITVKVFPLPYFSFDTLLGCLVPICPFGNNLLNSKPCSFMMDASSKVLRCLKNHMSWIYLISACSGKIWIDLTCKIFLANQLILLYNNNLADSNKQENP